MGSPGQLDEVVARLLRRFESGIRARLTPDELDFLDTIATPPTLTAVVDVDGPALRFAFFGRVTVMGWDGSEADGLGCINALLDPWALDIAEDASDAGGWRASAVSPRQDDDSTPP